MLTGTAYYFLEQWLKVLHINLRSNFTDTAYATSLWTNAHRYYILLFRAMITGTAYKSLEQSHRYCIHFWSNVYRNCIQVIGAISQIMHTLLHFGPLLTGTAYYLLEHCFQVLHMPFGAKLTHTAYFLMGHCSKILHKNIQQGSEQFRVLRTYFWTIAQRYCILLFRNNYYRNSTLPLGTMLSAQSCTAYHLFEECSVTHR
jgi:hypothetical protein